MAARVNALTNAMKSAVVALLIGLAIAGCAGRLGRRGNDEAGDVLHLTKMSRWVYAGNVEWTVGTNVSATQIEWVMDVVDVIEGARAEAAVVRGFVKDLAWYEPARGAAGQFTVIARDGNRLYQFGCSDEATARAKAKETADTGVPPDAEVWLDLPLAEGKRWAFDSERTDLWYCWYVEEEKLNAVTIQGLEPRKKSRVWKVVYRTAPDHQVFTIADGVGIVGFEFEHHGTVARAKMALRSVTN